MALLGGANNNRATLQPKDSLQMEYIKMLKAIKSAFCVGIISFGLSAAAEASLINGNNGLIYDTVLDITWFGFGNAAAGSIYDDGPDTTDGRMTWANANNWAANLEFLGFTDWRLPSAVPAPSDPSCNYQQYNGGGTHTGEYFYYNCTGSEMGHLFAELGGVVDVDANTSTFDETVFDGLLHNNYWSGTAADTGCDPLVPAVDCAWDFDFKNSVTEDYRVNLRFHALAVSDGDIGNLAVVPLPPAVWLFGSGLIALLGVAKRKANA